MRTPSIAATVALVALGLAACSSPAPTAAPTGAATAAAVATTAPPTASAPAVDAGKGPLEAAVRKYSAAYFAGDATTAYGMLSRRCADSISKDAYAAMLSGTAKAYGKQPIKTITVDQLSGNLARVSYTYSEPTLNQAGQPWTREGGAWHYDAC